MKLQLTFNNLKNSKPPHGADIYFITDDGSLDYAVVKYKWRSARDFVRFNPNGPKPEPIIYNGEILPYRLKYLIGTWIFEGHEDLWWILAADVERIVKECSEVDPYLQTK